MQYLQYYESPLGQLFMTGTLTSLTGLWFVTPKYCASALLDEYQEQNLSIFAQTKNWLDIYFKGNIPDFTPALSLEATPFRKMVWDILLTIPYGQTTTYGEIAKKIAQKKGLAKMSPQAVGGAVGHNPISLIIPCHRVIGANGNLTGYAGGIDKKIKLLNIEKINTSTMFIPHTKHTSSNEIFQQ